MNKKTVFLVFEDFESRGYSAYPGDWDSHHDYVDVFGNLAQAKECLRKKCLRCLGDHDDDASITKSEDRMIECTCYSEDVYRFYIEEKELEFTEEN